MILGMGLIIASQVSSAPGLLQMLNTLLHMALVWAEGLLAESDPWHTKIAQACCDQL